MLSNLVFAVESQGHRGARGLLPENTLEGFAAAISIGVNTLELDVVVTADDHIVVTHNPRLEPEITRDPQGQWLSESGPVIRSITLAELKMYDIGGINPSSRYAQRFPDQEDRPGTSIPTLVDVITLVKTSGNANINLNVETKLSPNDHPPSLTARHFAQLLVDVLRAEEFIDRAFVQSFNWSVLTAVHDIEPRLKTSFLSAEQRWLDNIKRGENGVSPWTAGHDIDDHGGDLPRLIKHAGGDIWSSYFREVTKESISQAHDLGLRVSVWTVNEEADMEYLINLGVDSIITDYPDRMINVMKKLGISMPPS